MRKRLYFMLPDVPTARKVLDTLLLARVEERHIRFIAKRGTLPDDLPEAGILQKTDLVHGAEIGFVIGGIGGILAGIWLVLSPPDGISLQLGTILIMALFGALFGLWVSSMVGTQVANSKLKAFHHHIDSGKLLMMIDVPARLISAIHKRVAQGHPEAEFGGIEPTIPAFP